MKHTVLSSTLALCIAVSGAKAAGLPAAPSGFTWQFVSANTYTDTDSGSISLNASGNFGTPSVTSIAGSLSLTTFNQASAPSGQFYCVTSSDFATSFLSSTNASLYNFSGSADSFYGALSLGGLSIGGTSGASAGPSTSTLSRTSGTAMPVGPFGVASFLDAASGASSTSVSLADTGTVGTNNGSNLTFTFSGNSVAFFQASSGYTGTLWTAAGSATYDATITTLYDVYELVPLVPEPGVTLLGAGFLGAMLMRRRRIA